ncbi:MAG TPA: AsmA family protein [Alphaproteobacteria bacterium]
MLKRILIGLGIVVGILIVVAVAVPFLIPVETLRSRIELQAQEATGRPLTIKGPLSLSVLPSLALEANDVSFGNVPGAADPDMATLKRLVLELRLLPLISGSIQVSRFVLIEPSISLEVDKNGVGNWIFAKGAPGATQPNAPAPGATQPPPTTAMGSPLAGRDLRLGEVRLDHGKIIYRDDRTNQSFLLDRIGVTVQLPDLESPFEVDGQVRWNRQIVRITAKANALGKILAGQGSPFNLVLASKPINLSFDGELTKSEPLTGDGSVKLAVPSLRGLASWAGSPLPEGGQGLAALSIEGKLAVAGKRYSFSDAAISLDDMKGNGQIVVDTASARPNILAKLDLDKLDLNQYMTKPQASGGSAPASAQGGAPAKGPAPSKAPTSDWSDDPIDVSALKAFDADFAFSVGAIEIQAMKIGESQLDAKLKDGLLVANLGELNLYDGTGKGSVDVDAKGNAPAIKAAFDLADVQAGPLFKDAFGSDRLSGKGSFQFEGAATGNSQRALVSALNGKGKIMFRDGTIKGINIAAMARNISPAFLDPTASQTQKTDFSELSGTFTITNGILSNRDLELVSPLLRVSGAGISDLPRRTVDYKITPKAVGSTIGQGGKIDLGGVIVPILVSGRWDDLHYQPDLAGAVEENTLGLIKGAIPGSGSSSGSSIPNPVKILKGLFGN